MIEGNVYAFFFFFFFFGGGGGGGGAQTNCIVRDVQIANIDLNHFVNTHLTKWLRR